MKIINDCTSLEELYGSTVKIELISKENKVLRTRYMTIKELYEDLYPPEDGDIISLTYRLKINKGE